VDDKYERLGIRITSIGEVPYLDPAVEAEYEVETKGSESNGVVESNAVETNGLKAKAAAAVKAVANGISVNGN
jgi:hypothetical protein